MFSLNYNISIEGMVVGNTTTETSFTASVSSGASYTYMSDQIYKEFTTTVSVQFHKKMFKCQAFLVLFNFLSFFFLIIVIVHRAS